MMANNTPPAFEIVRSNPGQIDIWYTNPSRILLVLPICPIDRTVAQTETEAEFVLNALNAAAAAQ